MRRWLFLSFLLLGVYTLALACRPFWKGETTLSVSLQYAHRIQRPSSIQDEAEVRFEYVSRAVDSSARWCRHHVQFHHDYHGVRDGFSPKQLHISTGGVIVEDVIRFLIADLEIPPLTEQWEERLKESEARSWEWIRWEALE